MPVADIICWKHTSTKVPIDKISFCSQQSSQ